MKRLYRLQDGVYMTRDGRMCIERHPTVRDRWDVRFREGGDWKIVTQTRSLRDARAWLTEQAVKA